MSEVPIQTTIEGDVSGQIAVGSYINQFKDLNGCNITIMPADERPNWKRHSQPANIRPGSPRHFLDRTSEIARIKEAIKIDQPITLSGVSGIGKSTLLKHLAHLLPIDSYKDGIYWFSAYNLKLDDLLQCLFSAFHESRVAIKPDRAQIQIAFQEIRALILIDDLMLSRDEIQVVLDIAPKCVFMVASTAQVLRSESEAVRLGGLPENDALTLFEQELGRSLVGEERQLVTELCQLLNGHPDNIGWIAAKVHEEGLNINAIIPKLKNNPPETLFLELVQSLPQIEQQILSILAVADGRTIAQEHLIALVASEAANPALENLTARGLIQSHSPAYSLSESRSSAIAKAWSLSSWEESLIQYFAKWLAQKPADHLVEEIRDTLLTLLNKADRRKNWSLVISLGRALEPVLILRGYWQAWNEVLQMILEAGKALGDRKVEGWALHQLGSRSLCLGVKEEAGKLLKQAASIRQSIGDQAGLNLTLHNLSVLTGAPPTGGTGKSVTPSQLLQYTMAGIGTIVVLGLALLAGLYFYKPAPPTLTQPPNGYIEETSRRPDFEWSSVRGGANYQIQVDDQQDFSSPEYDSTSATTTQTSSRALKQGIYYWRVRAISRFKKAGSWSETWSFTISIPPAAPALINPTNGFKEESTVTPSFEWNGVENAVRYQIQVDDNEDFSSPEYITAEDNTGRTIDNALAQGIHYWHIRALNQYDTPGDWSETWSFTISIPPAAPTLINPTNSFKEEGTVTPSFEWNGVENAIRYQMQVDDNQDFSSLEYVTTEDNTARTIDAALAQGIHYWRVQALNPYDTPGDWSETWSFTISIPPSTPNLLEPAIGQYIYINNLTFKWQNTANTHSYELQVDNNPNFSSPVFDGSTFFSSQTPPGFAQGQYYWRVRAFNIYGTSGPWSTRRQFIISIPPGAPILYSPGNNETIYTTGTAAQPTFSWYSVTNANQYQIQIYSYSYSSIILDSPVPSTQFKSPKDLPLGYYAWRVRAINPYGTPGPWSSFWVFHIQAIPA